MIIFRTIPAWMPGLVLFVIFPLSVYLPNDADFSAVAGDIALLFLGLALAWALLCAPLIFLPRRVADTVIKILFFLGAYLLLADIVAPVQVEVLQAGTELKTIFEPQIFNVLQGGLFAALILAVVFVPWNESARSLASAVVVILLVIQFVSLVASAKIGFRWLTEVGSPQVGRATTGNVYHLVFDSYGPNFQSDAAELGVTDQFGGFTLFKNAMTNAVFTELSIPSFMSGILPAHDPDGFKTWKGKWLGTNGILGRFEAAGYDISEYQGTDRWSYGTAKHSLTPREVAGEIGGDSPRILFAELVLLRAAPNFLKQEVFPEGRGLISRMFSDDSANSDKLLFGHYMRGPTAVSLLRHMIADEADRPARGQYVYVHVLLPHVPYNIDRTGAVRASPTSWHEQSLASVHFMVKFIDRLKELGRYQNATIIFQGDHGLETDDEAWDPSLYPSMPEAFFKDPRPLLLIKPPGESGEPLRISDIPAQLVDIAPTLFSLFNLSGEGLDGHSLLADDFPVDRQIHVLGYESPKNVLLQHFVLLPDGTWVRQPNIPALESVWQ